MRYMYTKLNVQRIKMISQYYYLSMMKFKLTKILLMLDFLSLNSITCNLIIFLTFYMHLPVFFRPRFGQKKSTVLSRTDIEKTETPSVKVCCMICKIFQKVLKS